MDAGRRAVAGDQTEPPGTRIAGALDERVLRERRLAAQASAVAHFEAEFGAISGEEIAAQHRADGSEAQTAGTGADPSGTARC